MRLSVTLTLCLLANGASVQETCLKTFVDSNSAETTQFTFKMHD